MFFSTILLIALFLAIYFTSTSPVCRETDLQHTASLLCLTAISSAQKLWLGFSIGSFGYQRLRPWWKCCSPWGQGSLLSQNERRGSHQTPASHSTSPPGAGTAATSGGQQALGRSTRDASFQFSGFGIFCTQCCMQSTTGRDSLRSTPSKQLCQVFGCTAPVAASSVISTSFCNSLASCQIVML